MTLQNFTQKSQEAVQEAQNLAIRNNHQQLEQIHCKLLGVVLNRESVSSKSYGKYGYYGYDGYYGGNREDK